jgi:hypothetical protein
MDKTIRKFDADNQAAAEKLVQIEYSCNRQLHNMKDNMQDMNSHLLSFKLKLEEMQSNQSVLKFNLNEIRMI